MRNILLLLFLFLCAAPALGEEIRPPRPAPDPVIPETKPETTEPAPQDKAEDDEYAKLAQALTAQDEAETEIIYYHCQNVSSSTLKKILDGFTTQSGTVASSEESDTVVISDVKDNIVRLRGIAENVDQRVPQVLVKAQIVELTLDSDFEREVSLAFTHLAPNNASFLKELTVALSAPGTVYSNSVNPKPGMGATFRPYVKSYNNGTKRNELSSFLRYLENKGVATILSAPNLILRRGVEGNIITGEELPIQEQTTTSGSVTTSTKYKSVGIKLKVCPLMISGDTIRLSVRPEVSNVSRYSTEGNPVIAIRSADTELEIKDGELISIGGLLRTEEKINKTRVPIAGALPVIGHLFRSARRENIKSQLVIFLTIDILQEGTADGVNVTRPDDIPPFVTKEIKELNERETKARRPRAQLLEDFDTLTRDGRD
jgi:type II secretory pathway component GspD/PulD (secretin)